MKQLAGASLSAAPLLGRLGATNLLQPQIIAPPKPELPPPTYLTERDHAFLEDLEKASFQYFWDQADPKTGMVRDRCNVRASGAGVLGSTAATGFGLTALCIGEKRGFVSAALARERVIATLRFLWKTLPNEHGFFYHWANISTGERLWQSEFSSVDTALLLCGILTCRQHFQHPEIKQLAHEIFNRVD
jgi:hypothetical protein